jgi:hypothetical protein
LGLVVILGGQLLAAPLESHATRSSPQDLEVTTLGPDGKASAPVYYTYAEFCTLPQVTVTTKEDPNTLKPATYTGVLVSDLFAALGAKPEQSVLGTTCYDGYQQYFDGDFNAKHKPIFLIKFDGKPAGQWPKSDQGTPQEPYSIVYENFVPSVTIYGYTEQSRIPYGIVSAQLLTHDQVFKPFDPKSNANDPEVLKGQQIAMGSCISCHNIGEIGGHKAMFPWSVLAVFAATNGDYFRSYVVNPQQFNPKSAMTAHPTFDAKTLDALQKYFKSMNPN